MSPRARRTIGIRLHNPNDFDSAELLELKEALKNTGFPVRMLARPLRVGYGVTWYEVVSIIIPALPLTTGVVKAVRNWARKRRHDRTTRPFIAQIYGPDGQVVKEVKVDRIATPPKQKKSKPRKGSPRK